MPTPISFDMKVTTLTTLRGLIYIQCGICFFNVKKVALNKSIKAKGATWVKGFTIPSLPGNIWITEFYKK